MNTDLRWLANESMSCLHAAEVVRRMADAAEPRMAAAIAEATAALVIEVTALGLPEERFWEHVIPLSAQMGGNRHLADVTLRKCGRNSDDTAASHLATRIGELESAVRQEFPTLAEDMTSQGLGLRDQWDRIGTDLLRTIAHLIEDELLPGSAEIVLVYPVQRGGGSAHVLYNSVRMEATEDDPVPKLPEAVRLAWLISQLNLELPMFSETVNAHRLPTVAALATLPAALQAAEAADLAACDQSHVKLALKTWMPQFQCNEGFTEQLLKWWEVYSGNRPRFGVAIGALDQILQNESA